MTNPIGGETGMSNETKSFAEEVRVEPLRWGFFCSIGSEWCAKARRESTRFGYSRILGSARGSHFKDWVIDAWGGRGNGRISFERVDGHGIGNAGNGRSRYEDIEITEDALEDVLVAVENKEEQELEGVEERVMESSMSSWYKEILGRLWKPLVGEGEEFGIGSRDEKLGSEGPLSCPFYRSPIGSFGSAEGLTRFFAWARVHVYRCYTPTRAETTLVRFKSTFGQESRSHQLRCYLDPRRLMGLVVLSWETSMYSIREPVGSKMNVVIPLWNLYKTLAEILFLFRMGRYFTPLNFAGYEGLIHGVSKRPEKPSRVKIGTVALLFANFIKQWLDPYRRVPARLMTVQRQHRDLRSRAPHSCAEAQDLFLIARFKS